MEDQAYAQTVRCPLCGAETGAWATVNGYQLFRCHSCAFTFVHPTPSDLSAIYTADYFHGAQGGFGYVDYDADKASMIPVFRRYLDLMTSVRPGRGTLLDVGAATGFFVRLAREDGWDARGVEVSEDAAAQGRAHGLEIRTGTIADMDGEGIFDAVTFLDVLEHLPDPISALRSAHHLLKTGGVIAVNVPDIGSAFAHLMGPRWHAIVPPEHLSYFSEKTLSSVLERVGFVVKTTRHPSKSFSLPYILSTFGRWVHLPAAEHAARRMEKSWAGKMAIPLPLGDNVLVIATKEA